jgi:hypothetical protein
VKCNHFLNQHVGIGPSLAKCPFDFLFYTPILGVEGDEGFFSIDLLFFRHCGVNLNDDARSPLLWYKEHVRMYPNVTFFVR